jgi:enoyl-CoA hydratase/carnithine racemase
VAKLDLQLKDKVAVLTMNEEDNKLNLDMCDSLLAMLDRVEQETQALTLVITSGHERIWSNGFDTDWITARLEAGDKQTVREFLSRDLELRRRLLLFPLITIAAINGHVFGGGAVMSCCCDFRFMRMDRGFFCIPVVDRGFPIVPGTAALLQNVMPFPVAEELVLTGHRFTGAECAASHIVAAAYTNDELMDRVMAFAGGLNKGRWIIGQMKQGRNGHVVKLMEEDLKYIEEGQVKV